MQPKTLKISTSTATQKPPRFWLDVPHSKINHGRPMSLARAQNTRDFEKSIELPRGAVAERPTNTLSHVVPGPPTHLSNLRDSSQLHVAVDVDEVLGRFVHSLNKFCEEEYGLSYEISDYFAYDFAKVWSCSQDESNQRVHDFFDSHHFAAGIEVIPGAFDVLRRLKQSCNLMVVTSRQHIIQEPTLEWLESHFPDIFSEVHFGNHFALEGSSRKKSDICAAIGADVLIDDNPGYALECAKAGIKVLLYDWRGSYPWAKTDGGEGPRHDLITRVSCWEEAEAHLLTIAAGKVLNI